MTVCWNVLLCDIVSYKLHKSNEKMRLFPLSAFFALKLLNIFQFNLVLRGQCRRRDNSIILIFTIRVKLLRTTLLYISEHRILNVTSTLHGSEIGLYLSNILWTYKHTPNNCSQYRLKIFNFHLKYFFYKDMIMCCLIRAFAHITRAVIQ